MALELNESELIRLLFSIKVNNEIIKHPQLGYYVFKSYTGKFKWDELKLKKLDDVELENLFLQTRSCLNS